MPTKLLRLTLLVVTALVGSSRPARGSGVESTARRSARSDLTARPLRRSAPAARSTSEAFFPAAAPTETTRGPSVARPTEREGSHRPTEPFKATTGDDGSVATPAAIAANVSDGRAWTPFYWGPQGYLVGPPWFGAGLGGGNWRVIPNHTPFGPPGFNDTDLAGGLDPSVLAALDAATPYEPVHMMENFTCNVYSCRLGVVPTNSSVLQIYRDSQGEMWARLACFLFMDDFPEYGCREWDRLRLSREKTDKLYDCEMPDGISSTPVWENNIQKRRSKLECEGRIPGV